MCEFCEPRYFTSDSHDKMVGRDIVIRKEDRPDAYILTRMDILKSAEGTYSLRILEHSLNKGYVDIIITALFVVEI